jgi:hypothetical protein
VLAILRAIIGRLEDVTIERDALADILHKATFTRENIEDVWADAKSDPAIRSKAHQALADLRQQLEMAGKSSALEMLLKDTPTSGKPQ